MTGTIFSQFIGAGFTLGFAIFPHPDPGFFLGGTTLCFILTMVLWFREYHIEYWDL